jgi:hypothetical protein
MLNGLVEYYRCNENLLHISPMEGLPDRSSFFRYSGITCWGPLNTAICRNGNQWHDVTADAVVRGNALQLPFDPTCVADNLRHERYVGSTREQRSLDNPQLRSMYYAFRRLLPVPLRRHLQRLYFRDWREREFPHWPVDSSVDGLFASVLAAFLKSGEVDKVPFVWFWPDGHASCAILTHDVETAAGLDFCPQLMDMDEAAGVRSSFQIVPEQRYVVPPLLLATMRSRRFEVNVHDLNHDGRLFADRAEFCRQAEKINQYAKEMGSKGFRSGSLYRNQDWFEAFDFEYDMSVPNVGHLEAQYGGCCTVMPYFVKNILELPLTTIQDYSLFTVLQEYCIDLWKAQARLIRERHGLIHFLCHPDYVSEPRAKHVYEQLLSFIRHLRAHENVWLALPGEVNDWWRARSRMTVVHDGHDWHVEGHGKERARVAFARLKGDSLVYEVV